LFIHDFRIYFSDAILARFLFHLQLLKRRRSSNVCKCELLVYRTINQNVCTQMCITIQLLSALHVFNIKVTKLVILLTYTVNSLRY